MSFFYQAGKITTDKCWNRPTLSSVKKFIETRQEQLHCNNLTPWVCGTCVYDISSTWDLDVWFTGEYLNLQLLEDTFHELYDFALNECRLKIDLKWVSCNVQNTVCLEDNTWKLTSFKQIHLTPTILTGTKKDFNNDYKNNPKYTLITRYLVQSEFGNNRYVSKKLHQRLNLDGNLKYMSIKDFISEKCN
jgi:hypothetical protein